VVQLTRLGGTERLAAGSEPGSCTLFRIVRHPRHPPQCRALRCTRAKSSSRRKPACLSAETPSGIARTVISRQRKARNRWSARSARRHTTACVSDILTLVRQAQLCGSSPGSIKSHTGRSTNRSAPSWPSSSPRPRSQAGSASPAQQTQRATSDRCRISTISTRYRLSRWSRPRCTRRVLSAGRALST
jgi:hypothetical protein